MDIIQWLRTPEGETWSKQFHMGTENEGGNPVRYSYGMFATIKDDHECHWNGREFDNCGPFHGHIWVDNIIKSEIERYGMNGVSG